MRAAPGRRIPCAGPGSRLSRLLLPAFCLYFLFNLFPPISKAQDSTAGLLLPASASSALMLGAADRLVVPDGGSWRLLMAPLDVSFVPGVYCRRGERLLVGTSGKGLLVLGPGERRRFHRRGDGLAGDLVEALAVGVDGRAFVGCDGGLSVWDGRVFVTYTPHNSSLPSVPVRAIETEPSGGAWLLCKSGGAYLSDDGSLSSWPGGDFAPSDRAYAMSPLPGSGLAVADSRGLHLLDGPAGKWSLLPLGFVVTVMRDSGAGYLLLGSPSGLYRYDPAAGRLFVIEPGISVFSMAIAGGQVWLSSDKGVRVAGLVGALARAGRPLAGSGPRRTTSAPPAGAEKGICRAGDRLFAFGTAGLFLRLESAWTRVWPEESAGGIGVTAAVAGLDGSLWFAADDGRLFRLKDGGTVEEAGDGRGSPGTVLSMTLSADGSVLELLTSGRGIVEVLAR